jgi:glutathione peroxidase
LSLDTVNFFKGFAMKQYLINTLFSIVVLGVSTMANAACSGIYNHQFTTLQGQPLNLCDYQDKPILVVNTASKCGFTPQFEALEGMYKKYKDQGLLVIGFPSNDFRQDPGTNKQIGDFCKLTYAVQFPMMEKSSVTGKDANPFYKELIAKTDTTPKWNFYKYLILPGGKEVYAYASTTKPDDDEIMSKIKKNLK